MNTNSDIDLAALTQVTTLFILLRDIKVLATYSILSIVLNRILWFLIFQRQPLLPIDQLATSSGPVSSAPPSNETTTMDTAALPLDVSLLIFDLWSSWITKLRQTCDSVMDGLTLVDDLCILHRHTAHRRTMPPSAPPSWPRLPIERSSGAQTRLKLPLIFDRCISVCVLFVCRSVVPLYATDMIRILQSVRL